MTKLLIIESNLVGIIFDKKKKKEKTFFKNWVPDDDRQKHIAAHSGCNIKS